METIALADVAGISGNPICPAAFPDEEFALYSIPAYSSGEPETTFGTDIGSNKTLVRSGHVLISKLNPRIPRVWLVGDSNGCRQICSTEFIPFEVRDANKTDPEWLAYVLLSPQFIEPLQNAVRSSTRSHQRVRPDDIARQHVPSVPLREQHRIVTRIKECLERVEEIERLQSSVLDEASLLPAAFRYDLWNECARSAEMIELGSITKSAKNGLYKPKDFHGQGVILLRMFNINGALLNLDRIERLEVSKKEATDYLVSNGDILVSRVNSRELVGKSALVEGLQEVAVHEAMLIRLRMYDAQVDKRFLVWLLNSPQFLYELRGRAKHAIGQSSINQKDLLSSKIPLPSIEEQRMIVESMSDLSPLGEELVTECTERQDMASRLRESILRKAFAGEL